MTNNDLQNIAHTTKDRVTRHKCPRVCSTCCKHFPVLSSLMTYHRVCNQINTTGATSGAETAYPSGIPDFLQCFSGVRVARSLVVCVCFQIVVCHLVLFHLAIVSRVVCTSSIYRIRLSLWYRILFLYSDKYLQHSDTHEYFDM